MIAVRKRPHSALTLVELITIVAILAILTGLIVAGLQIAKRKGHEAGCSSNLRQFGIAIVSYRSDNHDLMPPWLSSLYPNYVKSPALYLCLEDRGQPPGSQGSKPSGTTWAGDPYTETNDNLLNATAPDRNPAIQYNSYMYEFCSAKCSWGWQSYLAGNPTVAALDKNGDGVISWAEAKYWQLDHGDNSYVNAGTPYSASAFPVVRCFWHAGASMGSGARVLNLSYDGRVFASGLKWEDTSK